MASSNGVNLQACGCLLDPTDEALMNMSFGDIRASILEIKCIEGLGNTVLHSYLVIIINDI